MRNAKLLGVKDSKDTEFDLFYNGWSPSTGEVIWALMDVRSFLSKSCVPTAYKVAYYTAVLQR
ncbi:MAG: hypothetical protein ACFC1C_00365 [Candidatus Malihini olakiniferum]